MSGSYDNTGGRPARRSASLSPYDTHEDPLTGAPTLESQPRERPPSPRLEAPEAGARGGRFGQRGRRREPNAHGSIVPADSVTGGSLTLVITIMCFLACLTSGAVYMIYQSADAWLRDVASEVTVQVSPRGEAADMDRTVKSVASYLERQPGISAATPLSIEESVKLLEPWLGTSDALKSLPVPRLIAIRLDRDAPPNFDTLSASMSSEFEGVTLDDHRHWQQQIRTVTGSFALGGIAILILVGLATTLIIVSATRSAMASNREIVEVLHFVGATDGFIAREFEKHFLRLGIRAGIVGAVCAMAVFFLLPPAMILMGGGSVTMIELQRLIGAGSLDAAGYVLLGIVVVVISALCMLTSRFGVYRILNARL